MPSEDKTILRELCDAIHVRKKSILKELKKSDVPGNKAWVDSQWMRMHTYDEIIEFIENYGETEK